MSRASSVVPVNTILPGKTQLSEIRLLAMFQYHPTFMLGLSTAVLYSYTQVQSGLFFHALYLAVMTAALWNDYASYERLHERIANLEVRIAILHIKEIVRSGKEETKESVKEEVVTEVDEDEEALSANTSAWRSIEISE